MADEEDKKTEDKADAAKADADAGTSLDKVLKGIDAMNARMDRMDAQRADDQAKADAAKADAAKADADEDDKKADADEDDKPKEVVADKKKADAGDDKDEDDKPAFMDKKKDSDDDMDKDDKKADAIADSVRPLERRLSDVERLLPRNVTDAEYRAMADTQARADAAFQAFGDSAPRPLMGEDHDTYRRRLASKLKAHSPQWKDVNIYAIADSNAFDVIEQSVYADAMSAAMAPASVAPGTLREMVTEDRTGRKSYSFAGEPSSWMNDFAGVRRRVTAIHNTSHS